MRDVIRALVGLFGLGFLCMFPLVIVYFVVLHRMFRILAERHSDLYQRLGSPTLIANNTVINGLRFQWFLLTRRYIPLNDHVLTRLGNVAFLMTVFGIIVSTGLLISYIAYGVILGPPPR